MSISRIGGGYTSPLLPSAPETSKAPEVGATQTDQLKDQDQPVLAPLPRRHGLAQAAKRRALGRKKRDADNPHGADPSAESEDLLMMLEQHLLRDEDLVQKIGARNARDQQSSSQQRDPGGAGAGAMPQQHGLAGDEARKSATWSMRLVQRPLRNEADLLTQWRAAGRGGMRTPLARAEQAMLALPAASRRAAATGKSVPASPTYSILAIVREYLSIPEAERASQATLAGVRDRLMAAAAPGGAGQAGAKRPLSAAEESVNLLLPIALLNLGRKRTAQGRAIGISSLAALIRRGRGW